MIATKSVCVRCGRAVSPGDRTEPFTYPDDGRRVHSQCVGHLLDDVLRLMADVPAECRGDEADGEPC